MQIGADPCPVFEITPGCTKHPGYRSTPSRSNRFDGVVVGEYAADIVADGKVIVELLLNFGPRPEYRRKIMDNSHKGSLVWLKQGDTGPHGSPRI